MFPPVLLASLSTACSNMPINYVQATELALWTASSASDIRRLMAGELMLVDG